MFPYILGVILAVIAAAHLLLWLWGSGLLGRLADRLVDGSGQAWRWFSVQAIALAVAVQGAYQALDPDMKATIPSEWVAYVTIGILFAGAIGRLFKQGGDA